ncbi:MAG: 4Fe-4S dicluster domain-containing protein [Deltaproteobacteria bacterium]|nr:4Fe-4S dicluster domain-containing protein [Deltaproteobacteria bacterium]
MRPLKIRESRLPDLLDRWCSTAEVWAPRAAPGGAVLRPYEPGSDVDLDYGSFLEPPVVLLSACRSGASAASERPGRTSGGDVPLVLFGIRPCDAAALELLDAVPSRSGPTAASGLRPSRARTVVVLACTCPRMSCFCTSMGGGPAGVRGADLLIVPAGGDLLLKRQTARGDELLASSADLLTPAAADVVHSAAETVRAAEEHVALAVPGDSFGEPSSAFGTAAWRELVESCRGCGVCVTLCPTRGRGESSAEGGHDDDRPAPHGEAPAGGDAPEAGRATLERRDRWWRDRLERRFGRGSVARGGPLCVGCGRCIRYCPAGLDFRSVLRGSWAAR